jgi:hypothetical protein
MTERADYVKEIPRSDARRHPGAVFDRIRRTA